MQVHLVRDQVGGQYFYFVPDAETLAQGQALNLPNSVWVVGGLPEANAQLVVVQNAYKATDTFKVHFSQVKSVGMDSEGHNIWVACDITTESANEDVLYELFCDVQPSFQRAIGTQAALQTLEAQQQAVLEWAILASVVTLDALPPAPETK